MDCDATRPVCLSSVRGRLSGCVVCLRDEGILKEIKHAARLSREIKGWKETERSELGRGGRGREREKEQRCRN